MKENTGLQNRIYRYLTDPQRVKKFTIVGFLVFGLAIIIGYLIAQFDPAGPGGDLAGFNFIDNYISDLGSIRYTPFPYLLDAGCITASLLLIPMVFYLEKLLAPFPETAEELKNSSRMKLRLGSLGFAASIVGLIGMFGVGLFSEDLGIILLPYVGQDLHWIFTIVIFWGLAMASLFYGLLIASYDTILPKWLGIYMVFIPPICNVILFSTGFIYPLAEWITQASLVAFLAIGGVYVLRYINKLK